MVILWPRQTTQVILCSTASSQKPVGKQTNTSLPLMKAATASFCSGLSSGKPRDLATQLHTGIHASQYFLLPGECHVIFTRAEI